jgi:ABC-type branched-subunit amino acid transport system substrate-binding protein
VADRLSRRAALILGVAHAEPEASADRITFGQSAPSAGPAAALSLGMRQGVLLAAFVEANAASGVNGRRPEFVCCHDGCEPEWAVPLALSVRIEVR